MKKILIVEDDENIIEIVSAYLIDAGYKVVEAKDGFDGYEKFSSDSFDLVISDIMMPKMDGLSMIKKIREKSNVPVIMLTALGEEKDQLHGYNLQISDYLVKPFSPKILIKKIDVIFREYKGLEANTLLKYEDICIDTEARLVFVDDVQIPFTLKEYNILVALIMHKGKVLSREWIIKNIWGYDFLDDTRMIDTQVKNIRHKLNSKYILTKRGVGYMVK